MGLSHYMECQIGAVTVWPHSSKNIKAWYLCDCKELLRFQYVIVDIKKRKMVCVEYKVTQLLVSRGLCTAGLTQSTVVFFSLHGMCSQNSSAIKTCNWIHSLIQPGQSKAYISWILSHFPLMSQHDITGWSLGARKDGTYLRAHIQSCVISGDGCNWLWELYKMCEGKEFLMLDCIFWLCLVLLHQASRLEM